MLKNLPGLWRWEDLEDNKLCLHCNPDTSLTLAKHTTFVVEPGVAHITPDIDKAAALLELA